MRRCNEVLFCRAGSEQELTHAFCFCAESQVFNSWIMLFGNWRVLNCSQINSNALINAFVCSLHSPSAYLQLSLPSLLPFFLLLCFFLSRRRKLSHYIILLIITMHWNQNWVGPGFAALCIHTEVLTIVQLCPRLLCYELDLWNSYFETVSVHGVRIHVHHHSCLVFQLNDCVCWLVLVLFVFRLSWFMHLCWPIVFCPLLMSGVLPIFLWLSPVLGVLCVLALVPALCSCVCK